jgi:hypothetical protein
LASAIGGSILVAQTMSLGSAEIPSLTGYRLLFALCAGAGVAAAVAARVHPARQSRRRGRRLTVTQAQPPVVVPRGGDRRRISARTVSDQ